MSGKKKKSCHLVLWHFLTENKFKVVLVVYILGGIKRATVQTSPFPSVMGSTPNISLQTKHKRLFLQDFC